MRHFFMTLFGLCLCAAPAWADEFVPGRPGATESAISVPQGRWQIETELARFTRDRSGGDETRAWSAAATAFRYGIAHGSDVEILVSPYERVTVESGGVKDTIDGFGDVTLRARRTFAGQDGGASFGMIGYITLPTAEDGLGAEDVEGGVLFAGAFDLAPRWNFAWTAGIAAVSTDEDEREAGGSLAATLGYAASERWGLYVETALERAESDDDTAVFINTGASFLVDERTQLDAGVDFGVAGGADDVSVFVGWARLF